MHAENLVAGAGPHTQDRPAPAPPQANAAAPEADFRHLGPAGLAAALQRSRRDTLATFAVFESLLREQGHADLAPPYSTELNPPLWELGHIGWFQDWWLARYPHRHLGTGADPDAQRRPARRANADALYNSSQVAHAARWKLPLPDAHATCADLQAALDAALQLLETGEQASDQSGNTDTTLYFHRLVLAHEDMHHEAAVYMAQALGIPLHDPRWQHQPLPGPAAICQLAEAAHRLGCAVDTGGFLFDNECGEQVDHLQDYAIDSQVLRWRDYLPFVEAGGYGHARWWPGPAAAWRAASSNLAPRYLRREGGAWQQWRHGCWQALNLDLPACHLTAFEAEAWCAWAGRRLPTEAEWEHAAIAQPAAFQWGAVWEWTASPFQPFEGFVPHPYRDYSAPWFGSRRVLRGASVATQPRLRHLRYRNFFTPERNDIFAGFRSCAV